MPVAGEIFENLVSYKQKNLYNKLCQNFLTCGGQNPESLTRGFNISQNLTNLEDGVLARGGWVNSNPTVASATISSVLRYDLYYFHDIVFLDLSGNSAVENIRDLSIHYGMCSEGS